MSQSPQPDWTGMLTGMFSKSMGEMEDERQDFQDYLGRQQQAVTNSENRIVDRMSRRRHNAPEPVKYPSDLQQIIDMLLHFPQFRPVIAAVIVKLSAKMEEAFLAEAQQYTAGSQEAQLKMQQRQQAAAQAAAAAAAAQGGGA